MRAGAGPPTASILPQGPQARAAGRATHGLCRRLCSGRLLCPSCPRPALCPGRTRSAPAEQTSLCSAPGGARQGGSHRSQRRVPSLHWEGGEGPQGRCGVPKQLCLGWPPRGCRAARSQQLLLRQRGISARRILGRARPQRTCGDPRAHVGWPRPRTISSLPVPLADPRGFTTGQTPSLPQACLNGHITVSEARAGRGPRKELYGGKGDQSFQSWAT